MAADTQMELGKIPQILQILVNNSKITDAQQASILEDIKKGAVKGFAGEIAVTRGLLSKEDLDLALTEQNTRKTEAAIHDIENITRGEHLTAPGFLKANWGNNGVNTTAPFSEVAGSSAIANMLQNTAVLLKDRPEQANDPKVIAALQAADKLKGAFESGGSSIATDPSAAVDAIANGLRQAVAITGHQPTDARGNPVSLDEFIRVRTQEANEGLAIASARRAQEQGAASEPSQGSAVHRLNEKSKPGKGWDR